MAFVQEFSKGYVAPHTRVVNGKTVHVAGYSTRRIPPRRSAGLAGLKKDPFTLDLFRSLDDHVDQLPVKQPVKDSLHGAVSTFYKLGQEGSLVALGIANDWKNRGRFSLLGQTVQSPADLAAVAQGLRNPGFETLHYVLMDDDGKVLHTTAVSCRSPSYSAAWVGDWQQFKREITETAHRTGSTRWMLLHNHPSGDPRPSKSDIAITGNLHDALGELGRFDGHVIINSREYAFIAPGGDVHVRPFHREHDDELLTPSGPHPLLGRSLLSPQSVVDAAKRLRKSAVGSLIATTARGDVRAIVALPERFLGEIGSRRTLAFLRRLARSAGVPRIFLAIDAEQIERRGPMLARLINKGWLLDVVSVDSGSTMRMKDDQLQPTTDPYMRKEGHAIHEDLSKAIIFFRRKAV